MNITELSNKYLAWCANHRAPRTTEWYEGYLKSFLAYPAIADLDMMALKPFHIIEWVDSHDTWGDNYRRGAIVAVQRAYNWAVGMGYIDHAPFKKVDKPPAKRREIYTKPEDFEAALALIGENDPFRDLFVFAWFTGARPQEMRHIEPRHVELDKERIVFPAEESKGKRKKRIIYLHGKSLEIIQRLMAEGRDGKLFRNKRGDPWTKYSICNRMYRLSKILGRRLIMYGSRHGFITRKLIQGIDHLTIAELAGHTDGSMIAKVYSHISDNPEHLKKALVD